MRLDGRNDTQEMTTRVNRAEAVVKPAQTPPDEQVLNFVPMPAVPNKTNNKT
jgi:hypothetical protein